MRPTADVHSGPFRWVIYVMIAIAFLSMIQGVIVQERQAECNEAFRQTLKDRSEAVSDQNQAQSDFLRALATTPGTTPESIEKREQIFEEYLRSIESYIITRERNPYPDPKC